MEDIMHLNLKWDTDSQDESEVALTSLPEFTPESEEGWGPGMHS